MRLTGEKSREILRENVTTSYCIAAFPSLLALDLSDSLLSFHSHFSEFSIDKYVCFKFRSIVHIHVEVFF